MDLNHPVFRMLIDHVLSQQSAAGPAPMRRPGEQPQGQVTYMKDVEVLAVRTDPPEPVDPDDP